MAGSAKDGRRACIQRREISGWDLVVLCSLGMLVLIVVVVVFGCVGVYVWWERDEEDFEKLEMSGRILKWMRMEMWRMMIFVFNRSRNHLSLYRYLVCKL